MRRSEYEMPKEYGLELLDRSAYCVLGLTDGEGNPYTVPLNIARDGETVYFHAACEGFKTDCLRQNPRVCLSAVGDMRVAPFTLYYESVTARGVASEITDEAEKRAGLRLICDRYCPESMDKFAAVTFRVDRVAVWKIALTEVSVKRKFPAER